MCVQFVSAYIIQGVKKKQPIYNAHSIEIIVVIIIQISNETLRNMFHWILLCAQHED